MGVRWPCRGAALLGAALLLSSPVRGQEAPPILDRAAWGAKPALPGMRPQVPTGIIVHHTGEKQNPNLGLMAKLRGLQSFSQTPQTLKGGHKKPAWPDLPYHFYIGHDGTIGEGRDVRFAGDTNTGYDTAGFVQVVLEGNFEIEKPAPAQLDALRKVLRWQAKVWNVSASKITVHKSHAPTACPGKNLLAVLPSVMAEMQ